MSDDPTDLPEPRDDAGSSEAPEFRFPEWLESRVARRPTGSQPDAPDAHEAAPPDRPLETRAAPGRARTPREAASVPAPGPAAPRPPAARRTGSVPVREHTPEVEAWVARFRDPNGPPRIGSRVITPASLREPLDPVPLASDEPAPPQPAALRRPEPRRPPARRSRARRSAGSPRIATVAAAGLLVLGAGFVLSVAVRNLLRARPAQPGAATVGAQSTPRPALDLATPRRRRVVSPVVRAARPAAAPEAPAGVRYGIEVATYMFEDRALEDRDRLSSAVSAPCRVEPAFEDGAAVYRVRVGPLGSRAEAERVAADLFARGLVREAQVVRWRAEGGARP